MNYTRIAVIYNPNSTGPSKEMAEGFVAALHKRKPRANIELIATTHAGHAEELAYSIATTSERPLIISSSGDGGYHEVVNGALKAQSEGHYPTTGLLPAGNANDHYHNLHQDELIEQIIKKRTRSIDVLKLTGVVEGKSIERYAHSYIGFGLTPVVGHELNKYKLNPLNQIWIVIRSILTLKPVHLRINGTVRSYNSVIFSNVERMAKVLKVSQRPRVADGKFEVTLLRRRNLPRLFLLLFKATLGGMKEDKQVKRFSLETVADTLAQADGEVIQFDADTTITIMIQPDRLRCLV